MKTAKAHDFKFYIDPKVLKLIATLCKFLKRYLFLKRFDCKYWKPYLEEKCFNDFELECG